jgi:hypothetical protein
VVHLDASSWPAFLAEQGNQPGAHEGDVTIVLSAPVDGRNDITCPSDAVTVAAEQGTIHGLMVQLEGRRLFLPVSSVVAITDAPASPPPHASPAARRKGADRA